MTIRDDGRTSTADELIRFAELLERQYAAELPSNEERRKQVG